MSRKLRWGIMGSALIATGSVIPGIRVSETGEVFAIASRDGKKAKETAGKLGIPNWYGSYEEMLLDPEMILNNVIRI